MKTADGFYWIPILPKDMADKIKGPRVDWPKDVEAEYRRLHSEFTASKAEFLDWVRKDRDGRMNSTAKVILTCLVERLNFDTGRCDPSHQCIADDLEIGLRTVERTMPRIAAAGWIEVVRRGKTTSNFYRLRVPVEKVHRLLERVDDLRQRRADEREERRLKLSDPPLLADHLESDPPFERTHEPPLLAGHEPPLLAGKPLKGTSEEEPLKDSQGSEGEGLRLRAREDDSSPANAYAMAKAGDHRHVPFPVPTTEEDLARRLSAFRAQGIDPALIGNLRRELVAGRLTPAMVDEWRKSA